MLMEQNSYGAPPETVENELTSNHRRAFCVDDSFIDNLLYFDPIDFEISDISFPPLPPPPPPATTEMSVCPMPEPVEPQVLSFTSESDHPDGIGMACGGTEGVGEKGMKRRHKCSVSVDRSSTASSSVRKKVMSADTLDELAKTDPKKVKRILANRKAAARSKERKTHYLNELEMRVQSLQLKANNLNEELEMLKKNNEDLTARNNLARTRIEAVIQEGEKKHAFNQSLEEETRTLRIQIDKNAALMGNNPSVGELVSQISSNLAQQQFPNTQAQLQLAPLQQPLCVLPSPPPPPQPSPSLFGEPFGEHFVGSSFSNYNRLNYNHHK